MKRVLKAITLFILLGANLLANQPEWFLTINKPNTIIGFGQSENRREAISFAREEIVNSINVKISSELSVAQNVKNDEYYHSSHSNVKSTSSLNLVDSKIIKSINKDGIWYIAVEYSTLPTVYKLSNLIQDGKIVEPTYLNHTKFGMKLYDILKYHVKLDIFRKDGIWFLQANDSINSTVPLTPDDLLTLFLEKNRDNLKVKSVLHHNEKFRINFKSDKKYRTLISLEADGKVGVIVNNSTDKAFPSNQTMVMNNFTDKTIYEMLILIESDEKIDTHKFEKLHEIILDDSNYKFDELIYFLDSYDFSSVLLKVKN